jgi:hypothetical protein
MISVEYVADKILSVNGNKKLIQKILTDFEMEILKEEEKKKEDDLR